MTFQGTSAARTVRIRAPAFPWEGQDAAPRPYGARSDDSVAVGDLLMRSVPALARGDLEIVAIARRPGVLSKVAVRRRAGVRLSARPVSLVVGLGADYVRRVSAELGGERIHVVQWQGDPTRYVAEALGLGYRPPVEISVSRRLANVLLGDIDVRGARGRQGTNRLLASHATRFKSSSAVGAGCTRRHAGRSWRQH